jgi:peptide deformylase
MHEDLRIIYWPDPRLKKVAQPVAEFDQSLRELAFRMIELMREARGVGLAAPQVGRNLRLFVINPTGQPEDVRIYVNPELVDLGDQEEGEEGCLSIPDLHINVMRSKNARIRAHDLEGRQFEEAASGYIPRIWQHETDHLNGILLIDRMGPVAKLANRRLLKDLETKYAATNPPTKKPSRGVRRRA